MNREAWLTAVTQTLISCSTLPCNNPRMSKLRARQPIVVIFSPFKPRLTWLVLLTSTIPSLEAFSLRVTLAG